MAQGKEKTSLTPCVIPGSNPRPWDTRRYAECAFPVDTPDGMHSCCMPTLVGSSYCAPHHKIIYIKKPPKRLKPKVFW